jgi:hypothetical protein
MTIAQTSDTLVGLTRGAHLFIALVAAAAIFFVLRLLRRRQLEGKYALLWMASLVPLLVLAAFPGVLTWLADKVGVYYPPTLFLLLAVTFLFVVVVQFSFELSRVNERTRALAEEIALLRAEREPDAPTR